MERRFLAMCVTGLLATTAMAGETTAPQAEVKLRVGVYDSRAIAIAFIGSPAYKASAGRKMDEMMAERVKAKAEGNQKRVAEIDAWGRAQQVALHKQGFSTAPVDEMLVHIKDQIPEIARTAGVGPIVSKWDKETLAKYKSAERVDVTMALVDAFKPSDQQRETALAIQQHAPVSLEQAANAD